MGDATWTVTDNDRAKARKGIVGQANAKGLDMNDAVVVEFVEHQVEVVAALEAQCRFLQNTIHTPHFANAAEAVGKTV